ncbi:ribosome maturation factor RimM [Buchnera aphidicola]|uniref:Ribosome maturation factor RimM n=1 Tax=Buchnera aphidicola subsp. Acyrthosiphon pisum (strain 5A) TaxID=563178 RepID=A0A7U3YAF4_BUCA5|nr:ribosome maturation factor RimM [Buchnera aphidicola]ACL30749.1 16S rRNA processing protein RimM [Buchnera aphidicola str. 5A (Acyrthosiphon pisum)]
MINISINKPIQPLLIGKVGKSYGILGWINIFSFTEEQEKIFNYLPWFFFKEKNWTRIQIKNWKKYKNNFIVHIKDISDRSVVSQFTNSDIIISKHTLPALKKNDYYWNDIINYKVFNIDQHYLGTVINLIRTRNNDILIVKNKLKIHQKNILIPFIDNKIIKNVNTDKKFILVQWD